ncbi:MAG: S-layer homology domain-containing protein [Gorillibacterium sp.]|nr:S-layer homology domain-containing protein [Gorillibacterium sp.]
MKTTRKLVLVSAATLLALSIAGQALAATPTFSDIANSTAKKEIQSLQERGFVAGYNVLEFRPEQILTTAEGTSMITNTLQLSLAAISFIKAPVASEIFKNVKDDVWYSEAFINAHYNDVQLPADLNPAAPLTREQFTAYLMQGLEKAGNFPMVKLSPQPIADEADIDPIYQGGIQRSLFYKVNILGADTKFEPKKAITRAEAAIMAFRAREVLEAQLANPVPAE